jgi:hypothetical protein
VYSEKPKKPGFVMPDDPLGETDRRELLRYSLHRKFQTRGIKTASTAKKTELFTITKSFQRPIHFRSRWSFHANLSVLGRPCVIVFDLRSRVFERMSSAMRLTSNGLTMTSSTCKRTAIASWMPPGWLKTILSASG